MISSPVSRLPQAARSYLTAALVLMLVLVAVHFSVQSWAQQQAQRWMAAWEEQYGGHAGSVRLRMLRGALTIRDMQWDSEGVHFQSPFVLLRGNLSDSIEQIDIREIVSQGTKLTVSNEIFYQVLQQKVSMAELLPWAGLLDGVKSVQGDAMDIIVQAGDQGGLPLQPFVVHHVNFSSSPQQSQWQLSGGVWGGQVRLSSDHDGQQIFYSDLDVMNVTKSLGLTLTEGYLNGSGRWHKKQISGEVHWQAKPSSNNQDGMLEANLAFQGGVRKSVWQGDIQLMNWPLRIFSAYAPVLHDRILNAASLTGSLHMVSQQQGWQASMKEGRIRHLDYSSESKAAWYLQDVSFKKAKLTWPQRTLHVRDIAIEQGSWAVDSSAVSAATSLSKWKVDFPKVSFKAIKLGDIAKDIWLPDVQGKLSLQNQRLSMKASSDSKAMGRWKLQARGPIGQGSASGSLDIKVQAEHVPLLNFRDALPQVFAKDVRLNGDVSLDLSGIWNQSGWQLHGDMDGQNIMWSRGAWLWRAEQMQLENIVFGSNQMPHADVWQVQNWLGQTSLTPWSQVSHVDVAAQKQVSPFTLDGWQVKHINIGHGKFSLGQEDAVWFESDRVKLDAVEENQVMKLQVQGQLADGSFSFKGNYFPWGRTPWISMHASLKHALPFAAAPWLELSDLPILIRGRISADIKINQITKKPHHYKGLMRLNLKYGELQDGVSSNQLLSEATGYEGHGLFDRINSNGNVDLEIPLQGNWIYTPLTNRVLGQGLLSALAEKAALEVNPVRRKTFTALSNIRLHDSLDGRTDSLKHNERVRLRKVIHVLQREKKWLIELQPQLGKEALNKQLINRVRKTQEQITTFLVKRGISPSRIFPVWPEENNRQGEATGILIQAVK